MIQHGYWFSLLTTLRGGCHLAALSAWRMLRSRQTLVNALLLAFALLAATAWSVRHQRGPAEFVREIFLPLYVSFFLPIFSLCYASAGVAGERQDQTLVYLLATPLPRPVIYVAKYLAALVLVSAWNLAGFAALGWLGGAAGWESFQRFWPAVALSSLAYTSLFHLFSVLLHRADDCESRLRPDSGSVSGQHARHHQTAGDFLLHAVPRVRRREESGPGPRRRPRPGPVPAHLRRRWRKPSC